MNYKQKNINPVIHEFDQLGIINKKKLIEISKTTRDKKIRVYQEQKSGVVLIEKYLTNLKYYSETKAKNKQSNKHDSKFSYTKIKNRKYVKTANLHDDIRRNLSFSYLMKNKSILDYGCGWGSFLQLGKNIAKKLSGVEIRKNCIDYITKKNNFINLKTNLENFDEKFDLITAFHVLEHLPNQVGSLLAMRKKLNPNGKLIIEVPSAHDLLLQINELKEFKKFTFWSEHLVLHTKSSLNQVLIKAGFKKIKISFIQRYDLNNHIGWLTKKKPGGHDFYKSLFKKKDNDAYREFLMKIEKTDTLIAIAK